MSMQMAMRARRLGLQVVTVVLSVPVLVFTANAEGNTQAVAKVLFTQYFFPFEVTSILLLVAAIAAMVLAHRKARAVTQAEIDAVADEDVPVYDDAGAAS